MKLILTIRRQSSPEENSFWQSFDYETTFPKTTVADALGELNSRTDLKDRTGVPADKIIWECSCLQKKCGACAMVINGRPCLACDTILAELHTPEVRVEPLRKFPVIADLMVDRQSLMEQLRTLGLWLTADAVRTEGDNGLLYEASRCLQCGCCLEVCPNFALGEGFFGMAAMVPAARLLQELPEGEKKQLKKNYGKYVYSGCGKSLACRDICPAGIRIEELLVNSNRLAMWKHLLRRKIAPEDIL